MPTILLTEWEPDLKKVSLTKLLQVHANLSLKTAKGCVVVFLLEKK